MMTSGIECKGRQMGKHGKDCERIFLRPWEELVGILEKVSVEEHFLVLYLRTGNSRIRLDFAAHSSEAEQIQYVFADCSVGTKVGLVMTDSKAKPFLLRRIRKMS